MDVELQWLLMWDLDADSVCYYKLLHAFGASETGDNLNDAQRAVIERQGGNMSAGRFVQAAFAALLAMHLGACATVLEGTSQPVTVNTGNVADVDCTLTSPGFGTRSMKAPGVVTLEKSKHNVNVHCKKEGYEDGHAVIKSDFAAAAAGNILFGVSGIVIGGIVDAASGAGNKYDSQVNVVMAAKPAPEPVDPRRPRRAARAQPKQPPAPPPAAKLEPAAATGDKPQPKCSEVGGYEAYKSRTGEVCRL